MIAKKHIKISNFKITVNKIQCFVIIIGACLVRVTFWEITINIIKKFNKN
jgi:hypothetical protein